MEERRSISVMVEEVEWEWEWVGVGRLEDRAAEEGEGENLEPA